MFKAAATTSTSELLSDWSSCLPADPTVHIPDATVGNAGTTSNGMFSCCDLMETLMLSLMAASSSGGGVESSLAPVATMVLGTRNTTVGGGAGAGGGGKAVLAVAGDGDA
jgi:hypothetical protein